MERPRVFGHRQRSGELRVFFRPKSDPRLKSVFAGQEGFFDAKANLKCLQDIGPAKFGGRVAQVEIGTEFPVAHPLRQQAQDLFFAMRQVRNRVFARSLAVTAAVQSGQHAS